MGAISCKSFNNEPTKASRPFDSRREGFVPAHGGGVIVLESLESALRRGAQIHAEIVGIEANADGNHLPEPSAEGQSYLMKQLFEKAGIWPEQIDYINAHASSTPLGDRTEIRSIKHVFGKHASRLKINATKSILGHVCWSAPIVETIATVLQINSGELHPSINVDELESEIDLDVCANHRIKLEVEYALKNSFGFGGLNCVSIIKRFEK
jgi:3-oxoacyl-(acyl-carrier-protein) synthase